MDRNNRRSLVIRSIIFLYGGFLLCMGLLALFYIIFPNEDYTKSLKSMLLFSLGSPSMVILAIVGGCFYIVYSAKIKSFEEDDRVKTVYLSWVVFLVAAIRHLSPLIMLLFGKGSGWWPLAALVLIITFFINPFFPTLLLALFLNSDFVKKQFTGIKKLSISRIKYLLVFSVISMIAVDLFATKPVVVIRTQALLKHDPRTLQKRGIEAYNTGDYDRAIDYFTQTLNEAIKKQWGLQEFHDSYYYRGLAYARKKEYDLALQDLHIVTSQNPRFYSDAYLMMGTIYEVKGDFPSAEKEYTAMIAAAPSRDVYYRRAILYNAMGKLDLAVIDSTKAIESSWYDMDAYFERANAYNQLEDYDKALEDYTKLLEIRGNLSVGSNESDKVLHGPDFFPDVSKVYYNRGSVYLIKNDFNKALLDYNRAIVSKPDFGVAYRERARVYLETKDYDSSWQDIKKAQSLGVEIDSELREKFQKASGRTIEK
jgi:tetratricopeptide (TPR) repeat protein